MKKLITATFIMVMTFGLKAQIIYDKNGNHVTKKAITNKTSIKHEKASSLMGKKFIDSTGTSYPILKNSKEALYIIKTNSTGKKYRYYLKPNQL